MEVPSTGHDPVLLGETLDLLKVGAGAIVLDCTLGRAGHAAAIAQRLGESGLLIGLDVDLRNLDFARQRLSSSRCKVRLFHANFAELGDVLAEVGVAGVDGLLADLGVSTNQLFDPAYGMSFAASMPLDMRLDGRLKRSAADIVNHMREEDLANILFELAQERYSRRIARKIVEARRLSPINTTERLADIVRSAMPARGGAPESIDPATRTFLALRAYVNDEPANLAALMEKGVRALNPGGRMVVISFQSTEDRLVKLGFRSAEQAGLVRILTKKPLTPTDAEISANPRSRSSKLRAVERCPAPS